MFPPIERDLTILNDTVTTLFDSGHRFSRIVGNDCRFEGIEETRRCWSDVDGSGDDVKVVVWQREHHGLSLFTCDEEPAERFVNLFFEARIVTDEDELVIYGVRSVRGNIMC